MKAVFSLCMVLSLLVMGIKTSPAAANTTILVNTLADELATDGNCSLREAIRASNTGAVVDACPAGSGANTITLPAGIYTLSIAGANEDIALSGDLDITAPLILNGHAAGDTIIDANALDRVLQVMSGATVTLSNLTLRSGKVFDQTINNSGGGIYNAGTLTLNHVIVSGSKVSQSDASARTPQGGAFTTAEPCSWRIAYCKIIPPVTPPPG